MKKIMKFIASYMPKWKCKNCGTTTSQDTEPSPWALPECYGYGHHKWTKIN